MPKVGDVVAGKYEIERIIGEGGMGAVFSAMHKLTGKRVALKWMLPELARDEDAVQRFMREAQAAGRINHPNVVDVYDVGQHEDSFFLVMEFLQGEPLTAALERKNLGIAEILDLILPAMRGVAAAHRQGVVHRDLKPDNIFLVRDEDAPAPVPKVLDFGISKIGGSEGQVNPRLTKTGAVVGTPYYMCPEQIRGSHGVDKRADVYAFGVILYEALTGQVPFNADTYSALILEIATGTPKSPAEIADVPADLSEIVLKAMAREVGERFQDLESLGVALEPYSSGVRGERRDPTGKVRLQAASPVQIQVKPMGDTVTPFVASERPVVPRSGAPRFAAVAVGVGLALAVAAWFLTRSDAPDASEHVVTPAAPAAAAQPPALPTPPAPAAVDPAPAAPVQVVAPSAEPALAPAEPAAEPKSRRSRSQRAAASAAAAAEPAAAPVARPARANGRSGSISVDDF